MDKTNPDMVINTAASKVRLNPGHLDAWLAGRPRGPLAIEVGPVRGCNQHCAHCGFQQYEEYGRQVDMLPDNAAFMRFLDDFAALGGQDVFFAGNGEPLLHPELGHWSVYGRQLGLNMLLSTNGILLDDRRRESVLRGMKWIKFSVGGGNAPTYARVHGCRESEFDRMVTSLIRAVEVRNRLGLDCRLHILLILYDLNWQSLAEMVKLFRQTGADRLILRKASLEARRETGQPWPEILAALREYEGQEGVEVRWDTFRPPQAICWEKCYGIHFRTNMDHKGNVYTCARNFYRPSVYGNILTERFKDIWYSARKREVFTEVEQGNYQSQCGRMCQAVLDNCYMDQYLKGKTDAATND